MRPAGFLSFSWGRGGRKTGRSSVDVIAEADITRVISVVVVDTSKIVCEKFVAVLVVVDVLVDFVLFQPRIIDDRSRFGFGAPL